MPNSKFSVGNVIRHIVSFEPFQEGLCPEHTSSPVRQAECPASLLNVLGKTRHGNKSKCLACQLKFIVCKSLTQNFPTPDSWWRAKRGLEVLGNQKSVGRWEPMGPYGQLFFKEGIFL